MGRVEYFDEDKTPEMKENSQRFEALEEISNRKCISLESFLEEALEFWREVDKKDDAVSRVLSEAKERISCLGLAQSELLSAENNLEAVRQFTAEIIYWNEKKNKAFEKAMNRHPFSGKSNLFVLATIKFIRLKEAQFDHGLPVDLKMLLESGKEKGEGVSFLRRLFYQFFLSNFTT